MVGKEVPQRYTSRESDEIKSLNYNSDDKNNDDGPSTAVNNIESGIFSMEDLGQMKEVSNGTQTVVKDLRKDVTLQPPMQSIEVVETLSVSHFLKGNVIQPDNNGGNGSLVGQNEEHGTDKISGKYIRYYNLKYLDLFKLFYESARSDCLLELSHFIFIFFYNQQFLLHCSMFSAEKTKFVLM